MNRQVGYHTPNIPYQDTSSVFTATVPSSAYQPDLFSPALNNPLPLSLIFTAVVLQYGIVFTLDFASPFSELIFDVLIDLSIPPFKATISDLGSDITVGVESSVPIFDPQHPPTLGINDFVIKVTFHTNEPSLFPPGSYNDLDNYNISQHVGNGEFDGVSVSFFRFLQPISNTNSLSSQQSSQTFVNQLSANQLSANQTNLYNIKPSLTHRVNNHCCTGATGCTGGNHIIPDLIRIPNVTILGQTTTVYGDYLSDYTFKVQDDRYYNDGDHACIDKCECTEDYIATRKVKSTKFFQYGPELQCVVKGKGKTLRQKVLSIYNKYQPTTGPSFEDFYSTLNYYAMLKYFLSRLLYGKFDINVLCQNNNKQFLKDLQHSRFCFYYNFLTDSANGFLGFERYFLKC